MNIEKVSHQATTVLYRNKSTDSGTRTVFV